MTAIVEVSFLLQAGIALIVAVVLSWLWRARSIGYLRWVSMSWWCLVAYTSAAGIAVSFSMQGLPSTAWNVAAFLAILGLVLHVTFVAAGVHMMLRNKPPAMRMVWSGVIVALVYATLAVGLPPGGPAGAIMRQLFRGALPGIIFGLAYGTLVPLLWRARRPGEHGMTLLAAAFALNAAVAGSQGLAALSGVWRIPGAPSTAPWYLATVIAQAMFGLAWIGVLLEVEQRQRADAAERANRADRLMRDALNASDDLIGIVDQLERLVICNTRMAATIKELTGTTVTPLMAFPRPGRSGDDERHLFSTMQRALRGERVHERTEVVGLTGRRMVLDRRIVPIREGDQVTGAFVVARDVTEDEALRMEAERSLRIEGMARMAGGLAHDFNNILTVVQTNLQLLAESSAHDIETNDILMETAAALDRANQLTRRLLGVAREKPAVPTRVDVADLLHSFTRFLQHAIGDEVVLAVDVGERTAAVQIDHGRLEQVLLNLALNGRDAMPRGGTLHISVRSEWLDNSDARPRRLPPGTYVSIAVRDEGTGMDAETLDRAGDPFFTTKPATVGSGLGLATCRTIISEAGGALTIASTMGAGTTVTIVLPSLASA
jgi:signal transduction histidine kinase